MILFTAKCQRLDREEEHIWWLRAMQRWKIHLLNAISIDVYTSKKTKLWVDMKQRPRDPLFSLLWEKSTHWHWESMKKHISLGWFFFKSIWQIYFTHTHTFQIRTFQKHARDEMEENNSERNYRIIFICFVTCCPINAVAGSRVTVGSLSTYLYLQISIWLS